MKGGVSVLGVSGAGAESPKPLPAPQGSSLSPGELLMSNHYRVKVQK
jgi:hypothetical protein